MTPIVDCEGVGAGPKNPTPSTLNPKPQNKVFRGLRKFVLGLMAHREPSAVAFKRRS